MKIILVAFVLVVCIGMLSLTMSKRESVIDKTASLGMKYRVKDLPDHGISLYAPSDTTFTAGKTVTHDPYTVFLNNTSARAVVGYCLKWECFDGQNQSAIRDLSNDRGTSNITGVVFLHGEESDRRAMLKGLEDVIMPNSIWLISFENPPRQISGAVEEGSVGPDETAYANIRAACPTMTVTVDGIFFDDGTFVGPDTTKFFDQVRVQMEARYEVLQGVRNAIKSGMKPR